MGRITLNWILVALFLCTILLGGCGDRAARFTIEGTDNRVFQPNTITVNAGQTDTVTFTAPKTGEYPFSSGVLEDLDTMKGKIIVK